MLIALYFTNRGTQLNWDLGNWQSVRAMLKSLSSWGDCGHAQTCALWRMTTVVANYRRNRLPWNTPVKSLNNQAKQWQPHGVGISIQSCWSILSKMSSFQQQKKYKKTQQSVIHTWDKKGGQTNCIWEDQDVRILR